MAINSIISQPWKLSKRTRMRLRLMELNSVNQLPSDRIVSMHDLQIRDPKVDCRLATTAAMAASTYSTTAKTRTADEDGALADIDGVAPVVGDRILDKDHATTKYRGIWVVTSLGGVAAPWVLTRASDFDTSAKVTTGATVYVSAGDTQLQTYWTLTTTGTINLDTDGLTFSETSAAGFATYAELASIAAGKGASLIGIQDPNDKFVAEDTEAALEEAIDAANAAQVDATQALADAAAADAAASAAQADADSHAARHVTGGADVIADVVAAGASGLMSGADKTKLNGIAAAADVTGSANVRTALGVMDAEEDLNVRRVARAIYDFAVDGGAVGAINIGPLIPSGCFVTRAYYQIVTALTSGGAATIALRYQNTDAPAYVTLVAAALQGDAAWLNGGFKDAVQDGTAANFGAAVQGAVGNIQVVIADFDLTAGKFCLFVEYQRGTTP